MATDVGVMPNGNYAPHQPHGGMDHNGYAYGANAAVSQSSQQAPPASSTPSNAQQPDISKDEVGWYFVEQYYTTLSRSPEKLYLFYNKRSQLVSGQETDKVQVCIGQRAINDKIKELDFQDCKVRVTNVDSQASDSNIVIQVIGEISNKSKPHRKFTQTFVLATQTNGYFVLNDIFRYLLDEEEEAEAEAATAPEEEVQQTSGTESGFQEPASTEVELKTLTSSADPAAVERDAKEVDKSIEEKLAPVESRIEDSTPAVNGESAPEETNAEEANPAAPAETETLPAAEAERPSPVEVEDEPEKPKDPEPTPAASPPKQAAPQAAPATAPKAAAPAVPMTWAGRAAAANRVATPVTIPAAKPAPATPAAPAAATPKATSPNAAPTATQTTPSAPAAPSAPASQRQDTPESQDEWNTVGHSRQPSRQTTTQQPEMPQHRGYIKNVHDHVNFDELRSSLDQFGDIIYFDIARQKNCAFVDFKTLESYNKATQTPFKLGDDEFCVEERRMRPGQTPYIPRGQFQGGRGRGGAGGQGSPRGGFQNNRGGNGAPRGRGGFQATRGGPRGGGPAQ